MILRSTAALIGIVMLAVIMGLSVLGPGMERSVSKALPRISEHAATKHVEGTAVQTRYSAGMCDGLLVYFSPPRGTLLFLCQIPQIEPVTYGGLLYRITENGGLTFLGEEAYMVTVFVGNKHYWNGVLARDRYKLWAAYTNLHGLVRNQFPDLYW